MLVTLKLSQSSITLFKMPVRVSQANSRVLIGRIVEYWSRGEMKTSRILGVSASGKTLVIDNLDLQNGLQVVSRIVHLID